MEVVLGNLRAPLASALLFVAWVGWGRLIARGVGCRDYVEWGLACAYGMAWSVVLGGLLDFFAVISVPLVRVYVACGVLTCLALIADRRAEIASWLRQWIDGGFHNRFSLLAASTLFALLLIRGGYRYSNSHDDYHAYLVFPCKMLQSGSLGCDPFSERRMLALGGQSFLDALLLGLVNVEELDFLEESVGGLAIAALVVGHCLHRKMPWNYALLLLATCFCVAPPIVNLSSVTTGAVLFYGLLRTFCLATETKDRPKTALLALLAAGICGLKNSHVAGCLMLLTVLYASWDGVSWRVRHVQLFSVAGLAGVLLTPWLWGMYRSSGTLLYPLLGQGFHGSVYSDYPAVACGLPFGAAVRVLLEFAATGANELVAGAFLSAGVLFRRFSSISRPVSIGLAAVGASAVLSTVLVVVSGGMGRYGFSFSFPAVLFLMVEFLPGVTGKKRGDLLAGTLPVAMVVASAFLVGANWSHTVRSTCSSLKSLSRAPRQFERDEFESLRAAQSTVPAGAIILVRAHMPFLMDFRRNPIYIIDWPGGAGPPPGVPCFGTAEQLAVYLRENAVRYVLYSYANQAGFSSRDAALVARLQSRAGPRERLTAKFTFAFQDRLQELQAAYGTVFDDGHSFVVDLGQGRSGSAPGTRNTDAERRLTRRRAVARNTQQDPTPGGAQETSRLGGRQRNEQHE